MINDSINRRRFLSGVALGAASLTLGFKPLLSQAGRSKICIFSNACSGLIMMRWLHW